MLHFNSPHPILQYYVHTTHRYVHMQRENNNKNELSLMISLRKKRRRRKKGGKRSKNSLAFATVERDGERGKSVCGRDLFARLRKWSIYVEGRWLFKAILARTYSTHVCAVPILRATATSLPRPRNGQGRVGSGKQQGVSGGEIRQCLYTYSLAFVGGYSTGGKIMSRS